MNIKFLFQTTKYFLLTTTLLAATESFAGKRSCTDTSRLRSIATLQGAVASGPRAINVDIGGFKEGAASIHIAQADSLVLEQFAGKSFGAGATPFPVLDPSLGASFQSTGLTILNPGPNSLSKLTLYSIGTPVRNGVERFLKPGEKYKILVSTFSQLRTNCLVHYDSAILTVQLPELEARPVVPSISLLRYGIDQYDSANGNLMPKIGFLVQSSVGIIGYRILLNGVQVSRMNGYWLGASLNLREGMRFQDGMIISAEATKVPQIVEIEVTTLEGVVETLRQEITFSDNAWIGQ